jgi:CubicO group peptidase (beta-lactamase class C family)
VSQTAGVTVAEVLEKAIEDAITPGLAAGVVVGIGENAHRSIWCRGHLAFEAPFKRVTEETVFDLASLTKILCTTPLVALAVEEGHLELSQCPFENWPGVTVEHLLRHQSGLVDWRPYYQAVNRRGWAGLPAGRDQIVHAVLAEKPRGPAPADTLYSDPGFIALGHLVEKVLGDRLDRLYQRHILPHFGKSPPRFVPIFEKGFHPNLPGVAPTERCPWRGRVIQGQVHDDNAFAMGGVAGHAGLFGSINGVLEIGGLLLEAMIGSTSVPILSRWAAFAAAPGERGLGFDKPTPGGSTGDAMGPRTAGHLGFTGVSLWADPDAAGGQGAAFVLLTNRVHPQRDAVGIRQLRIDFHRAAATAIA